jgi:hypothetical protein
LRGDKVTPSTTIKYGTAATLLLFVGASIAAFVNRKLRPSNTPKPKITKNLGKENPHKEL